MRTIICTAVALLLVASSFLIGPTTAESPPEKDVPKQAAYSHYLRFQVLEVTSVEKTETHNLLRLKVQPWYGKIQQHDYDLHKKHDTQEFTLLFPAAVNAAIRAGDIIDYRLDRYIAMGE